MKKLLALLVLFSLVATPFVISKPMREWTEEYYDLDCDGIDDLVYVYTYEKSTKKGTTITKEYYDPNWNYLGEEEWINDELMMDTFEANNPGYCPGECQTDEDCPTEWKCEITPYANNVLAYHYKPKSCVNNECVYGDWTWGGCDLSVSVCDDYCENLGYGEWCEPPHPCNIGEHCESDNCEPNCNCAIE